MGHGYSSRKFKSGRKSSPNEVKENLEWILEEIAVWEDGNRFVCTILAGRQKETREPIEALKNVGMAEFDFEAARLTLEDIDALVSERKKSGVGLSESTRRPSTTETKSHKESARRSSTMETKHGKESQALGPGVSTSSFSQASSVHPSEIATYPLEGGLIIAPSSSLFSKIALNEAARRAKLVKKSSVKASSALDEEENTLRNEIGAKYLYIDQLLYRMQQSAQNCYKLHHRNLSVSRRLQSKKTAKLSQTQSLSLQKIYDDSAIALENALRNFDNARNAVGWMYSDYELQIALFRCRHHLLLVRKARQQHGLQPQNVASNTYMANLDQVLFQLQERYNQLHSELQQNELYCILVALSFYDRTQKGYLIPQDVPEMSASMFSLLDVNNDRSITPDDLQKSIVQLNDRLASTRVTINRIAEENDILALKEKSELNSMRMSENQDRIYKLRNEMDEDHKTLKAIYNYFHTGFARSAFNKLESDVTNETCNSDDLLAEIEDIDFNSRLDPLGREIPDRRKITHELYRAPWVDRPEDLHAIATLPLSGEVKGEEAGSVAGEDFKINTQERVGARNELAQAQLGEQVTSQTIDQEAQRKQEQQRMMQREAEQQMQGQKKAEIESQWKKQPQREANEEFEKPVRIVRQPEVYTLPQAAALEEGTHEVLGTQQNLPASTTHEMYPEEVQYRQGRQQSIRHEQAQHYNPEEAEELITKGYEQGKNPNIEILQSGSGKSSIPESREVERESENQNMYNKARIEMLEESQTVEPTNAAKREYQGVRTIY